jgi:hypothetical protein
LAIADTTPQALPFSQDWTNTGLITVDDIWTGVPGITGWRGDDATQGTGVNPCGITLDYSAPIDVNANQTNPNTFATGGVAEFDGIPNPVVALTGSGTADDPNLVVYLNTTGWTSVVFSANLRDIDGSVDNAIQPIAVQYRVGNVGAWTNLNCTADASSGPSLATLVTPVAVPLPAAADNQIEVQVRVMTTNAVGNDEWIGVDDIVVAGTPIGPPPVCQQFLEDWGDAPECIPAYPSGVLGNFPTCSGPCGPGTQELACAPISTPPGPTGFMRHITPPAAPHFWLGCYPIPGDGFGGIDPEPDGKTNTPAVGVSACLPGLATDCVEPAFGGAMLFDQDECYADLVDHGVPGPITFPSCQLYSLPFVTANCTQTIQVFLNILVDWNEDGDWNDNLLCQSGLPPAGCAYEWAVKNAPIAIPAGCTAMVSPPFLCGPNPVHTWFRISLTLEPVNDDYPWAGSATTAVGAYQGGETEDYPANVEKPVPTQSETWGKVKARYR